MRRNISLYIDDRMVDLDDQAFILFNYTMEDLSNPTIVRNSFSKQITIPGTATNNKIFGDIFRLDRVTQYGDSYTGIYFDAMRKTPFTIYNEMSEVIESGYMKLDEIVKEGGGVSYKITLYGGLGSFFFSLMYNEDGSMRSLADMRYRTLTGDFTRTPGHFGRVGGYQMMKDAWSYLADPDSYDTNVVDNLWCNIINFSPCYNGLPDDFSADKALVQSDSFGNMPTMSPKDGASANLMLFTNPHTEWEVRDLRWYLQRPVFSIKALIQAICDTENNGGYEVILDSSFFSSANDLYENGWITMPMIPADKRAASDAIVQMLAETLSPADYLISFAKMFGLVFSYDKQLRISIMPRKAFYAQGELVDFSDRVDISRTITPVLADSRFYQFGGATEVKAEWTEVYKEEFGIAYAIQKVNTGNEFSDGVKIVTEGIKTPDAVEVQERSLLYAASYDRDEVVGQGIELFSLPRYEQVTLQEWNVVDNVETMSETPVTQPYDGYLFALNVDYPLTDWLPKMQFHEAADKASGGSNVFVVFNGTKTTPQWTSWAQLEYRLTADSPDMAILNEGKPCWNFTSVNSTKVTSLPSFRRCHTYLVDGDEVIDATYEWGEPKARGVQGTFHDIEPATLYNRWWKAYLSDRYDDDTIVVKCKVNLKGMVVGHDLFKNFYCFGNSIFVLNKIANHSLSTWDDTECEFIKVNDISNYR